MYNNKCVSLKDCYARTQSWHHSQYNPNFSDHLVCRSLQETKL